jgi:hypothetical protein
MANLNFFRALPFRGKARVPFWSLELSSLKKALSKKMFTTSQFKYQNMVGGNRRSDFWKKLHLLTPPADKPRFIPCGFCGKPLSEESQRPAKMRGSYVDAVCVSIIFGMLVLLIVKSWTTHPQIVISPCENCQEFKLVRLCFSSLFFLLSSEIS